MIATIRRYRPPSGSVSKPAVDQLRRQLHDEFLPLLKRIAGFHSYYAVNVGNREVVTVGVFETQAGASESTRRAAEFTKQHPLAVELGKPEIIEGEVLTYLQAPREMATR